MGRTFLDPDDPKAGGGEPPLSRFMPDGSLETDEAGLRKKIRDVSKKIEGFQPSEKSFPDQVEVHEYDAAERLQRTGIYPCKKFQPEKDLSKPETGQLLLVKKLASVYFGASEDEITSVQHISDVVQGGEGIFFSGAFSRPPHWALTGALEVVQKDHHLLFPQNPECLYRVQLRNGRQYWISHSSNDPLVPMGNVVFTKSSQEAFDPQQFRPTLIPFKPQADFQELVGRNTDLSLFAQQVIAEVQQQFGKNVSLFIVQAGIPGQSGPIIQVRFDREPLRLPVYLSAQQLAALEMTPELFRTLFYLQKTAEKKATPEVVSESIRGKLSKLLGRFLGNS